MNTISIPVLLLPILINACAMTRADSLNLLEKRADFKGFNEVEEALGAVDNPLLLPVRTEPQVADIWVHPHELANGDYFRGAWIRTVVSRSVWSMEEKHKPLLIDKAEDPTTKPAQKSKDGGHLGKSNP